MRRVLFALTIAALTAPVLAAPPTILSWTDKDTQQSANDYMKCVSDMTLAAGMDHKDVPAADVVNAAAVKCPGWQSTDLILQLQWDTDMTNRGYHTAGPSEAEPIIAKWRDDWFKDIAGQLTAKRLGM
jgi:hypothetical protein